MKTNTTPREVTTTSVESSSFTISNNAKIFKILIDGLYTNKIQSITREIWSNALDSHVQAGCADRPFDVSMPSVFDPNFRVRDYGVGLSHDMVMHLYTDLGTSTKEDTNDAIGKFGIGSKSPFAYSDNFTVTSWFDGEKRYYSAMIGADGVPGIHLLGLEPTTEPNGIEVAVRVHTHDNRAFADAARRVSYGFDVKPRVTSADFGAWPEMNTTAEGEGWTLLNESLDGYRQQAYARMGPVLYPIDVNALHGPNQKVRDVLAASFIIDFAMGDLEITASREDLSYGSREPTGDAIKKRAEEIYDEISTALRESYAACDTYFLACCKYKDDIHSGAYPSYITAMISKEAKYEGSALKTAIKLPHYRGIQLSVMSHTRLRNKTFRHNTAGGTEVTATTKTVVFVEDTRIKPQPKAVAKRLRAYYLDNRDNIDQIIWVRGGGKWAYASLINFVDDFDGAVFISEEDLPEYTTNRGGWLGGGITQRSPVKARRLSRYDSKFSHKIELSPEDFEKGGIYIPLERMRPTDWNLRTQPHTLYSCMMSIGLIDQHVIGAPKSMKKRFAGAQWVDFQTYAKQKLDSLDIDFDAEKEHYSASRVHLDQPILRLAEELVQGGHASTTLLKNAHAFMGAARSVKHVDLQEYRRLYDLLDIPTPPSRPVRDWEVDASKWTESLMEAYPLLDFVATERRRANNPLDIVGGYVIMCDTMLSNNHTAPIAAE